MRNDNIFLSFVIPVYGAEDYLEQCLESILNSQNELIEVIAINDGSPDNSKAILDKLAEKYSNLTVIHQANIGGAATINKGLDLACGEYVSIVDNDDYLLPEAVENFIKIAKEHNPDVISTKAIKKWKEKEEEVVVFDTKYITQFEILKAHQKPAIMNDGMYLGKIFKRSFINKFKIRMDPTLLYADRPFMMVAYACASKIVLVPETTYAWRQRENENNLSITDNQTSLSNLKDRIRSIRIIKFELESRGFSYWLNTIDYFNYNRIFWAMKNKKFNYLIEFAKVTKPYFSQINLAKMTNITPTQKFVIETIRDCSYQSFAFKYKKRIYVNIVAKKMRSIFNFIKSIPTKISKKTLKLLKQYSDNPLEQVTLKEERDNQLIIFESNFGKSYSGQPKYVYEELLRQQRAMRAVWVYQGKNKLKNIPGNVIQVHRGSKEYFHFLARAGYWVNNIRFTVTYKPEDTVYLQTWHGTPLKRLGLDIDVEGPEKQARDNFLKESANWDYLVAQNHYSKDIFTRAFNVKGEVLVEGYPANDSLLNLDQEKIQEIKQKLSIPKNKKVVLYAPTWRDNARKGNSWNFSFDLKLDLLKLKRKIGRKHIILLRLHHLIADQLDLSGLENFAFDVSKYDDTSEILSISDILITDYSSIYFDFMTTKKPILFYMYDLEDYTSKLRGFYLDVHKDLPGPIVKTEAELISSILKINNISKEYNDKYQELYHIYCGEQKINSAQIIVDKVFTKIPKLDEY